MRREGSSAPTPRAGRSGSWGVVVAPTLALCVTHRGGRLAAGAGRRHGRARLVTVSRLTSPVDSRGGAGVDGHGERPGLISHEGPSRERNPISTTGPQLQPTRATVGHPAASRRRVYRPASRADAAL